MGDKPLEAGAPLTQQPVQYGATQPPPVAYAQPGQGYPPPQQGYPPPQQGYQQQPAQPVMVQPGMAPGQEVWMMPPQAPVGCPPGLEYLAQIDQLIVKQQKELLEIVTGFETNNKYKIKNSLGQNVYFAIEDTHCCMRMCCGPGREFNMKIFDNAQNEVIHLYRPLKCAACCFPCCLQEIEVASPPGTPVGYIVQQWGICTPMCSPKFQIQDENRNPILMIEGPGIVSECCSDIDFKVMSLDGATEVGKVTKQWTGIVNEMFTDADTFGITFPMDLSVKAKATMLGAVMLLDFMFFEKQNNNNGGGGGY